MANDRMYIRCKGCGELHFLAKCYDDGYFITHEGEELRQGLDDFFDRHKWCYRDKYYGGFELVYESDDWLEKQKEQKPAWSEEDDEMLEYVIGDVNDAKQLYTTQEAKDMADKEIAWLKSLRPSWKPSEDELTKKHLEGYIKGRNDALREMSDFMESHFNTQSGTSIKSGGNE